MTVETEVAALTSAVNLLTSTVNVSKATLDASVAAAEAAYDSFDDRYLGAKVSAPSLDNDGGSLLTGALYFNSTENAMYVYTGASWVITTNYNNVTAPYTLAQTLNTNGNNVTFGDNGKATFGAGSDLQIYHDGSHSRIADRGTGDLRLYGDSLQLNSWTSAENYLTATTDGAVTIYHNGSQKLATTATGIDVTGTATMDGLTVDGAKNATNVTISAPMQTVGGGSLSNYNEVLFDNSQSAGSSGQAYLRHYANSHNDNESALAFGVTTTSGTTHEALRIDGSGDISFYEDTGTTAKLFWDASTESLGIGTSTPSAFLHLAGTNVNIALEPTGTNAYFDNRKVGGATNFRVSNVSTNDTTAMILTSAGRVGIGTSSPVSLLTVGSVSSTNHFSVARENAVITGTDVTVSATQAGMLDILSTSLAGVGKSTSLTFTQNTSQYIAGWDKVLGAIDVELTSSDNLTADSAMKFYTSAGAISSTLNERMRIDSSGNVGIGTSTPSGKLDVELGADGVIAEFRGTDSDLIQIKGASNTIALDTRNTAALTFEMQGAEAMRIDSSGNLLVGVTSLTGANGPRDTSTTAGLGVGLNYYGGVYAAAWQSSPFVSNRISTDGELFTFKKDGTPVGSIGSQSGHLYISGNGANSAGLRLQNNGIISPTTNAVVSGDTVDIGQAGGRFKNLYLSGGVYLGGTGAANKLDDYETGTWTPTALNYDGTMTVNSATYVKVGKLVTVKSSVSFDATADGSGVNISSLPFTTTGTAKANGGFVTSSTVSSAVRMQAVGTGSVYLLGADNSNVPYTTMSSTTLEFIMIYEAA